VEEQKQIQAVERLLDNHPEVDEEKEASRKI